VTPKGQGLDSKISEARISVNLQDRPTHMIIIDHQQETAHAESDGDVTDESRDSIRSTS